VDRDCEDEHHDGKDGEGDPPTDRVAEERGQRCAGGRGEARAAQDDRHGPSQPVLRDEPRHVGSHQRPRHAMGCPTHQAGRQRYGECGAERNEDVACREGRERRDEQGASGQPRGRGHDRHHRQDDDCGVTRHQQPGA
jgi:hypothetical protein